MGGKNYDYIIIEKKCGSLEHISDFIQERSLASRLNFKRTWELMLVIDEVCSSIVLHAKNRESELKLVWKDLETAVEVEIIDEGEDFNPLLQPEEDNESSELGAMGAYLIDKMVDKACYKRTNGINRTFIGKNKCRKNNGRHARQ